MKYLSFSFLTILLFLLLQACNSIDTYSEIPRIEYIGTEVSYEYEDEQISRKNVQLQFSVVDGDGDIGLTEADTISPFDSISSNFFSEIYVRDNNRWVSGTELGFLATSYRIPYIGEDYETVVKAEIQIDFSYAASLFPYDSIVYSFYIIDRALNQSNIDSTGVIVFN